MHLVKEVKRLLRAKRDSHRSYNALVLGGGGARGLAHIGVLKTLEANNIPIDLIVGCSFGALIGGVYAQTVNAARLEEQALNFLSTDAYHRLGLEQIRHRTHLNEYFLNQLTRNIRHWVFLGMSTQRTAILKGERLQDCVELFVKDKPFSKNRIPFACNATDLVSGRPFLFTNGNMREAIIASATIPGYFPPVEIGEMQLVDGAITNNLPIKFAHLLGADNIIAVDVHPDLQPENNINSVIDIILRTRTITANMLDNELGAAATILIQPAVKEYFWYEFERCRELIDAGRAATQKVIKSIKHLVDN